MIITVNSGSSSLKLAAYKPQQQTLPLINFLHLKNITEFSTDQITPFLSSIELNQIDAVCHRVVHGGDKLVQTCFISQTIEGEIEKLIPLAPLHNPVALSWIRVFKQLMPEHVQHIAVFDTAYYNKLPSVAREYAIPQKLCIEQGLHRFGFHGLAHQGMLTRYQQLSPENFETSKIISLQLGSGCSITASIGDRPFDTSMGFTPTEGLIMATRCGDIDPGLLCYLQTTLNYSSKQLEKLLNKESGLLGISSISADMRELLSSDLPSAQLAIDMYCYRIKKYIGAYTAALEGIDAIIFSGGVGENSPAIREKIMNGFQWLDIRIDTIQNNATNGTEANITGDACATDVWVIPSDESRILAEQAVGLMNKDK